MNLKQRELYRLMLQPGKYIMMRMSNEGESVFMVYEGNQVPVKYFAKKDGAFLEAYLKMDKKKRRTLKLGVIRKLDGRNMLKKMYKVSKLKTKTKNECLTENLRMEEVH